VTRSTLDTQETKDAGVTFPHHRDGQPTAAHRAAPREFGHYADIFVDRQKSD
jgi:hypothetical protein